MAQQIFFIDERVADLQSLVAAMPSGSLWVLLNGGLDGLAQMQAALEGQQGLEAIHLISHGQPGVLQLGSTSLSLANLGGSSAALRRIGQSLAPGGDLLLYGCNVAAGAQGRAFVEALAAASGVDVAASTDITGAGGNWSLEVNTGIVATASLKPDNYVSNLQPPPNSPPVSTGDSYDVNEDTTLSADTFNGVLANDFDPDSDPIYACLVSGPANGNLTLNNDGSFEYRPNINFNGSDSFSYVATPILYEFRLNDDYGDGWNGAYMELRDSLTGTIVALIGDTFDDGSDLSEYVAMRPGLELFYTDEGYWNIEVGMSV